MNKWKQDTIQEPSRVWPWGSLDVTVHLLLGPHRGKRYAGTSEHSALSGARQEALCRVRGLWGYEEAALGWYCSANRLIYSQRVKPWKVKWAQVWATLPLQPFQPAHLEEGHMVVIQGKKVKGTFFARMLHFPGTVMDNFLFTISFNFYTNPVKLEDF